MEVTESAITGVLRDKMFQMLMKENSGELPFLDYRVKFRAGGRNERNEPREAAVEVYDQEGYRVEMYDLQFEEQARLR